MPLSTQAKTQEEFIRGSMKKHPYDSSDFEGPLMVHIKKKICRFVSAVSVCEWLNLAEILRCRMRRTF